MKIPLPLVSSLLYSLSRSVITLTAADLVSVLDAIEPVLLSLYSVAVAVDKGNVDPLSQVGSALAAKVGPVLSAISQGRHHHSLLLNGYPPSLDMARVFFNDPLPSVTDLVARYVFLVGFILFLVF